MSEGPTRLRVHNPVECHFLIKGLNFPGEWLARFQGVRRRRKSRTAYPEALLHPNYLM